MHFFYTIKFKLWFTIATAQRNVKALYSLNEIKNGRNITTNRSERFEGNVRRPSCVAFIASGQTDAFNFRFGDDGRRKGES